MPNITITNLISTEVFINFLYVAIPAGDSIEVYRSASDLMSATRLQELVDNGIVSVDIEYTDEEKTSGFDIFPGFSLPEGIGALLPQNTRYVNKEAEPDGDGSILNPYQKIQTAIDDLEAIGGFDATNKATIFVSPGIYSEALTIHQNGISIVNLGLDGTSYSRVELQPPTGESALTLTNATPASLAAYNVSGAYSDLVNQGDAGPQANNFMGIRFRGSSAIAVRFLGVKGDYSPTQTEFGSTLSLNNCTVQSAVGQIGWYARNAGVVLARFCALIYKLECINCYFSGIANSTAGGLESKYDPADPEGEHRYASIGNDSIQNTIIENYTGYQSTLDRRTLFATASVFAYQEGRHPINLLNGAYMQASGVDISGDIIADGDCDLYLSRVNVNGDVSVASGAGTVDWEGGGWTGDLTDPDNKLTRVPDKLYKAPGVRYVDLNSTHPSPDGSFEAPYLTIQEAIDDLEAIGGWSTNNKALIFVQPGVYNESLVIHQDGINVFNTGFSGTAYTRVEINGAVGKSSLTLTNATQASLEAYESSLVYSDLVNQGDAGPKSSTFIGMRFTNDSSASAPSVRLLGVQGDYSPTETEFGNTIGFVDCNLLSHLSNIGIYSRNSRILFLRSCVSVRGIKFINGQFFTADFSSLLGLESQYDPADPEGSNRFASGFSEDMIRGCIVTGGADTSIIDNRSLIITNSSLAQRTGDAHNVSLINGASLQANGVSMTGDLTADGDCDLDLRSTSIVGSVTLGSGPGIASWSGGGWTGELTDPDDKLALTPVKRFTYPTIITSGVTALIGQRVRYDTSGGTFQINAPSSPDIGDSFAVKEIAGDTTNVTVSGNGISIEHPITGVVAASAVLGVAKISVTWEYDGTNWIVV